MSSRNLSETDVANLIDQINQAVQARQSAEDPEPPAGADEESAPRPRKSKKPVSDRKRAANQANAKKSTGPRTEEGKARSRQNALQHGLLARYVIPENDPVEKAIDYEALLYEFQVQFNPKDLFEHMCIRRLANCHWRLDRAMRYEIQAIENARANDHTPMSVLSRSLLGTDEPDPARHVLPPGLVLDRLIRYETMINRELQRVLNQLREHRKQPAEALEWSYKRAAQTKFRVDQGDVCPFCGETMKLPLVPSDPPTAPAPDEATGGAGVSPASTEPTPTPNEPTTPSSACGSPSPRVPASPRPRVSPSPSLKSQISDLKSSVPPSLNPSVPPSPAPNKPTTPPLKSQISDLRSSPAVSPSPSPSSPTPVHHCTCSHSHPATPRKQNEPKPPPSATSILREVSASPRLCGSIPGAKRTQPAQPSAEA